MWRLCLLRKVVRIPRLSAMCVFVRRLLISGWLYIGLLIITLLMRRLLLLCVLGVGRLVWSTLLMKVLSYRMRMWRRLRRLVCGRVRDVRRRCRLILSLILRIILRRRVRLLMVRVLRSGRRSRWVNLFE